MELRRYFAIIRKHFAVFIVVILLGIALGYATTSRTHYYRATSTLFAAPRTVGTDASGLPQTDPLVAAQLLAATYAEMIDSQRTVVLAVQQSGVNRDPTQLLSNLTVTTLSGTTLLQITVKDRSPQIAATLANALASAFVSEIKGIDASSSIVDPSPASLFESAAVPTTPLSTGLTKNLLLFGLLGVVLAIGLVLLLDYLDVTIRGVVDAQRRIELPVLGAVPLRNADA